MVMSICRIEGFSLVVFIVIVLFIRYWVVGVIDMVVRFGWEDFIN